MCSFIVTLITSILCTFMFSLNMSSKTILIRVLLITLIAGYLTPSCLDLK